jgi:hypothetical protein
MNHPDRIKENFVLEFASTIGFPESYFLFTLVACEKYRIPVILKNNPLFFENGLKRYIGFPIQLAREFVYVEIFEPPYAVV